MEQEKEKEQEEKKKSGFRYKEQHAVIIKVATEQEQQALFERLKELGFTDLKVVSV